MPLPGFSEDDEEVDALSPFGRRPGEAMQSTAESARCAQARRVWNAYHEEQALSEAERQYRRPVRADASLWGCILGAQLVELISRERANPRIFMRGGVADPDNPRCLLPGLSFCVYVCATGRVSVFIYLSVSVCALACVYVPVLAFVVYCVCVRRGFKPDTLAQGR